MGASTKPTKPHYFNPFIEKEVKVKCVHQWLVQVEAFMETQHYALDVK
jgi:hypothetical protein